MTFFFAPKASLNYTFLGFKSIGKMNFDKKKHYISNTGQLLTLKPNGTVYTKTGGDNFVNLSCGFPFNPKFGNTSRIPISECLWTRTIQFESGKNFSEKFFCKVSVCSKYFFLTVKSFRLKVFWH